MWVCVCVSVLVCAPGLQMEHMWPPDCTKNLLYYYSCPCVSCLFEENKCTVCVCVFVRVTCALPGKVARTIPGSSLLCMAVAETIWADDMEEMLCRAFSLAFWSCKTHTHTNTHYKLALSTWIHIIHSSHTHTHTQSQKTKLPESIGAAQWVIKSKKIKGE